MEARSVCGTFNEKEKIGILLEEYRTLRAEIIDSASRYNYVIAVSIGASTWFITGSHMTSRTAWISAGAVVTVALLVMCMIARSVRDIAQRLREIEHDINGRVGEHLLVWEQLFGGGRSPTIWGSLIPPRPWPRSRLRPLGELADPSHSKERD